jgi:hypothetical protein
MTFRFTRERNKTLKSLVEYIYKHQIHVVKENIFFYFFISLLN